MGVRDWFVRRRSPADEAGRRLYAAAVAQARAPGFYLDLHVPDTPEGRFELYALHVALLLRRLRQEGQGAAAISQSLFDGFVRGLDDALREMGMGDVGVAKRMKKLGQSLYGRLEGYEKAFAALPDRQPLEDLIGRTIYADGAGAPAVMADYALAAEDRLKVQDMGALASGEMQWPLIGQDKN
jgi:cytochrome b pre-mRNA-processing protein 3